MTNERDRLIRLIMKANSPLISLKRAEELADCLLDNGVIVPPCKIGDTIYKSIFRLKSKQYQSKVKRFAKSVYTTEKSA